MLIITLGDPFSINIELVTRYLTACQDNPIWQKTPVVIVGSYWHWRDQVTKLDLCHPPLRKVSSIEEPRTPGLYFLDLLPPRELPAEKLTQKERGTMALSALEAIPRKRSCGSPMVVLTCPINKAACHAAGFKFPGQTEFFEDLWGGHSLMILAGPKLRVGLATTHLALSQVAARISQKNLMTKAVTLYETLRSRFKIPQPKVAVCGLNPHCGENGLFGSEETEVIGPAIRQANVVIGDSFEAIQGPFPADTVFFNALSGAYDAVLAMYHDQGLGPLKTVHFDTAVNMTAGLPYLRISCDHGTATDRYLKKSASLGSFNQAMTIAVQSLEKDRTYMPQI